MTDMAFKPRASLTGRLRSSIIYCLAGGLGIALLTFISFRLRFDLATTVCLFLIVVVLLSLQGDFFSSAVVSLIAVGCLVYYFAPPIFSFRATNPFDAMAIIVFWTTSAVVTHFVSRVRKSTEGLREQANLLNLTHDSIFVRDMHDVITYWNHGAEEFYGWKADEVVGKVTTHKLLQTVFPTSLDDVTAELLRTGRWEGELTHTKADGTRVVVASRQSLQQNERQQPVASLELNNDVTGRRQAEENLRRSQAYLSEAQRLSHTGSFGWQVPAGEIFWSEETYHIFGYDRAVQPTLDMLLQRVHPDDRALVRQLNNWASDEGTNFETEYRLLMPDGTLKYLHVIAHGLKHLSGNLEVVGAVTDITAAKQAEQALRQTEEQWRDVFENNPTMYFMVDAAGKVMAVNPFGAEQLGYNIDELIGQPVLNDFHNSDREAVVRNIAACFEQLGQAKSWEARKVRKDGKVLWVRETAKGVSRANGPIALVACEDITEQKRAAEALRQAQANLARVNRVTTMGELTASLAHEVNQPIAAAVTNANSCLRWLTREHPDLEEARAAALRIVKDGTRAAEIISRTRLLFRKGTAQRELVDLNEVIREMIALLRSEAVRYSISIRAVLAEDLPQIMGDRVQLQQVLMNLMTNSIDAMREADGARELSITSRQAENEHLLVSVSDSGMGLPPGPADQIFNAFFTTKSEGTGMGLSIARSIVDSHGGRLWAVDNSPRGASFCFTLPSKAEGHE